MEVNNGDFLRKMRCINKKVCFLLTFPALSGPGPGPYGPIGAPMDPSGPVWVNMDRKNKKHIQKEIACIGAFKVPCTLP